MGRRGVVASGHYLATAAGFRMLERGGNAIDAAAATCFCLNLLEPHQNGIGGEVPMLIYSARERKPYAISGMGWSPQAFTIEWCAQHGMDLIPGDGYLPACTPAALGSWAMALARFGTLSLGQVLQPAIELAEQGYPMHAELREHLLTNFQKYTEVYPTTGQVYLRDGRVPEVGEIFRNPDWANMLQALCRAEASAAPRGRLAGLEAATDAFYRGPIAERIVRFIQDHPMPDASGKTHAGLLSYADLAEWRAAVEEPVSYHYRGLDVHKCGPWTQGPVFVQQLAILAGYDLKALGHASAEYLHTWIESAKLAFADREAYYGDPLFDHTPFDVLLSEPYNAGRRAQIGASASLELRPGDVGRGRPDYVAFDVAGDNRRGLRAPGSGHLGDTTHLDVVDGEGNMVSATPSGGWLGTSPVIAGLGFPIGTRGQMFYLNPARPNALAPRKRPRATLTPSLVTRDGAPYMVFGTPGGDQQDQITLQFFLNYVDFGMDIQRALEAPLIYSAHFPSSFYPRDAYPGRVMVEKRIAAGVVADLEHRGHEVVRIDDMATGKMMAIRYDRERQVILGGVSPARTIGYAFGW